MITNKYKLPLLVKNMQIYGGPTYTRCILLYGKILNQPIITDLEDVHEFHYILKDWRIYKIPYGIRRSPNELYTGYLDQFTSSTLLSAYKAQRELPEATKIILHQNLEQEIRQHIARVDQLKTLLKKISK